MWRQRSSHNARDISSRLIIGVNRPMRLRSMLIAAFAATAIPAIDAAPANAQTITSAQCVGGVIGCQQVDLFFTLVSGAPLDLHSFSLALFGSGWLFRYPTFVEAEDF